MEADDEDTQNKILQNALLFTAIRKNKSPEEKIKKITSCLNKGAGINIVDANNFNNTPLHVAVSKEDIDVVKFLLAAGASATSKNNKQQTPLDIAEQTKTSEGKAIANILASYVNEKGAESQVPATNAMDKMNSEESSKLDTQPSISKQSQPEDKKEKGNAQLYYKKRSGTSCLSGQLYETKLLSLILLRALYDDETTEFFLGANLEQLPQAFDDIYLMYKTKGSDKSRYLFLQVHHKEDPNKDKITVGSLFKVSGDFRAGFYVELNPTKEYTVPSEKTDVIAVMETEDEFKNLCSKYEECNIHWFNCEDKCFIWKRTKGNLNKLLQCVNREFVSCQRIQPAVLSSIKEKIVIISAEPGMGKSTFLTHLAIQTNRTYPKLWILKINLLEHIGQFSEWKESKAKIDMKEVIKFLFRVIIIKDKDGGIRKVKNDWENILAEICCDDEKKITVLNLETTKDFPELDVLEIRLFQHFYNNHLVALLFDGFDEISPDYTNEVLQMLCTLKSSRVAHIWVTTRSYNVLEQLEGAMGTFSFTLQALTKDEQETFLQRIWSAKLGLTNTAYIRGSVTFFFKIISFALRDTVRSFTSIPLHLYMVSEIFEDFFGCYCNPAVHRVSDIYMQQVMKTFNLIYLYEAFVEMKFFKIRFGEKKHFMCFKDPDIRKMVENERKTFLENHKKVGAYYLLSKPVVADLFSKEEIEEVREFIESVKSGEEKSGIVERMVGDDPKFVHLTFAEYFATEFLFDKFQSGSITTALQNADPSRNEIFEFVQTKMFNSLRFVLKGNGKNISKSGYTTSNP
ncbi:hypothetical protein B5X24_HaOG213458 [Helicoverpa armigera]|nr:hypothetical protein B5X24_HaOG213458 [Helicoverpa armigera]